MAHDSTVDLVINTQALTQELQRVVAEQPDYRTRVDAITALIRRTPDSSTGLTALIIALASSAVFPLPAR